MPATIPPDLDAVQAVSTTQTADAGDPPGDARAFSKALKAVRGAWTTLAGLDADGDVPAVHLDKVRTVPLAARIVTAAATVTGADDVLFVDSASAVTITVDAAALSGSSVVQVGAGQVTLAAGAGVTLQLNVKTAGQGQGVTIYQRPGAAGTFIVVGGVA